ncbi:MAG TPA: thymidine phosphorylase, partial [Gammaproteobacteria bacterium]|nr:thymidine phosphorylase [Gammaproteobacteria bacterium]
IVAACGLPIPKTSSRAITSPAGTADTMETLAPVDLDIAAMRRVVEREGGCIVWGGAVDLSPADDVLIRIERSLDLDSNAQLVASVLSKKISAGATHVVIDIPVGPTAKLRSESAATRLSDQLIDVGKRLALPIAVECTDGSQPVGRGIGPGLEARDVLSVLKCEASAPADLRERASRLAGRLLEFGGRVSVGEGYSRALDVLASGEAWRKFEAICEAQGGMRAPPVATHVHDIESSIGGTVVTIDNRRLAKAAKLAGAPNGPAAGVEMHVRLGARVGKGEPLYSVHAETPGELAYALHFIEAQPDIVAVEEGGI